MMVKYETIALTCGKRKNYLNIPFAGISYVNLFQALLRTTELEGQTDPSLWCIC